MHACRNARNEATFPQRNRDSDGRYGNVSRVSRLTAVGRSRRICQDTTAQLSSVLPLRRCLLSLLIRTHEEIANQKFIHPQICAPNNKMQAR